MEKKKGKEGEWKHGKAFSKQLLKQKGMDPKFKLFSIPKIIQCIWASSKCSICRIYDLHLE